MYFNKITVSMEMHKISMELHISPLYNKKIVLEIIEIHILRNIFSHITTKITMPSEWVF